ncbi:MAG: ChaN family lipoprotein [Leptolyngbya sp. BL-A-14]
MSASQRTRLWGWVLSLVVLSTMPISAAAADPGGARDSSVLNLLTQQHEDSASVLAKLAQADVVYLGETHDRPDDHQAQLEIIQALYRVRPALAIGMEMFQRPYQSVLDRYLKRALTETELQDQTQYAKRWGYNWDFYAPILRFAKVNQLPVIALNTPTEVTRKTARTGLESLTLADRRFIPPLSAIEVGPEAYRERLQTIYTESHHGQGAGTNFQRFFEAQVLWDETMAERIAYRLQQKPKTLVVVLVGQGHILYGDGIPARVARRLQGSRSRPLFTQVSLLLNAETPPVFRSRPGADYIWYTHKQPEPLE